MQFEKTSKLDILIGGLLWPIGVRRLLKKILKENREMSLALEALKNQVAATVATESGSSALVADLALVKADLAVAQAAAAETDATLESLTSQLAASQAALAAALAPK